MYKIMVLTKDRLKGMYLPMRFADYDLAMKYISELVELNASFGIDHLDYEIEEVSNDIGHLNYELKEASNVVR